MNKINKQQGPMQPLLSALVYFPDVFQRPRDRYLHALIRKVAEGDSFLKPEQINVYLGNIHVSPLARAWNTNTLGAEKLNPPGQPKKKSVLLKKRKKQTDGFIEFENIHFLKNDNLEESAESKIEKQALLEVICGT